MEFIPDPEDIEFKVPYFEDARNSDGVIGYATKKNVNELKALIREAFGKLGGSVISYQFGKFGTRYACRIRFAFRGVEGRIDLYALPIRRETNTIRRAAKCHILYSLWMRLQAEYNTMLIMPGDVPFVPYMLNEKGQTMLEYMRDIGQVPVLPEAIEDDILDGEFTERD